MPEHITKDRLTQAYDPSNFRALGHQLIDLLADHLEKVAFSNSSYSKERSHTHR